MSASRPQFVEWVYETYRDQLHIPELEGSRKYQKFLDSMDINTLPLSGAIRVQSYHIIKFGYPMRRAGYLTAAFRVKVKSTHKAYFAYAYWPRDSASESCPPEYICMSPTFESRDGEYRHRFLWFKQFEEGYEEHSSILSPIEECLLKAIGRDEVAVDLLFFPESEDKATHAAAVSYAESSRLGIKALVAALAVDALRARERTLQIHSSPSYVKAMGFLYKKCEPVLKEWSLDTRSALSVFVTGKANNEHRAQCGQKLIPLTVREALQVGDINFAPWREVWVSRRATALVVNGVAPMFPIFNNWTYLNGVDRTLFENKPMHARFDRSLQAEGVAKSLRDAREQGESAVETDYRMGQLDAHVYDAIAYAQDYVLLTDLAMCATSEYVGFTLRSLPDIVRRSESISPAYLRMYADPSMQARYFFDLCYGAHMLHTRAGALHGDLHLNNATIYHLGNQYVRKRSSDGFEPRYKNPVIAYTVDGKGETDTYIFPHDGWFACLIDFSRAIIAPGARADIAAEFGEPFATGFYRSQISRALRILHHYIPDYVEKHQERIKGLLLTDPDPLFRVMCAVDFLAIGRNYGALLRELAEHSKTDEEKRSLEVAPEGIALAETIEQSALEHLVVHLTDLLSPKRRSAAEIPYAGETVIPAAFAQYRYSAWAAKEDLPLAQTTLVDLYNGGAPLKYSGSDYARFPPWARFDELERHLGGIKIADVTADRGERPFLESRDLDGYLEVLQEQVRRKLNDKPAAATSSWIAD